MGSLITKKLDYSPFIPMFDNLSVGIKWLPWYGLTEVRTVENQPMNLSEVIGCGAKVIITLANNGLDKRVRLGKIVQYDALNRLISVQQNDNSVCSIPLSSIASIEILRNHTSLNVIGK